MHGSILAAHGKGFPCLGLGGGEGDKILATFFLNARSPLTAREYRLASGEFFRFLGSELNDHRLKPGCGLASGALADMATSQDVYSVQNRALPLERNLKERLAVILHPDVRALNNMGARRSKGKP
ncbi:MAG: hypothetical protein H7318_17810 [Oligoflexus sp.]|nr:hypothetical protein [Oligoflexus sp.]